MSRISKQDLIDAGFVKYGYDDPKNNITGYYMKDIKLKGSQFLRDFVIFAEFYEFKGVSGVKFKATFYQNNRSLEIVLNDSSLNAVETVREYIRMYKLLIN